MKTIIAFAMFALVSVSSFAFDNTDCSKFKMPMGMKGSYETIEAKILKVFAANDNGAKFRAYLVRWRDSEVVVSDPLGTTDKKEGDPITFMAQRMEMPMDNNNIKTLQFMIMDFSAFLKLDK